MNKQFQEPKTRGLRHTVSKDDLPYVGAKNKTVGY